MKYWVFRKYLTIEFYINDSKENGILDAVKFVFAGVHGSLNLVLQKPYKNRSVFPFNSELEFYQFADKVTTKRAFSYENEFEELHPLNLSSGV